MINIKITAFAEEGAVVWAVADHLKVSHDEAERMYVKLGGYSGNGTVVFSTVWPCEDPFSVAVQDYMTANNIKTLRVGYED